MAARAAAAFRLIFVLGIGDIDSRPFSGYFYCTDILLHHAMTTPSTALDSALHAIADPTRRRILGALKQRSASPAGKVSGLCAGDIEERMRLSQPTISHHMAILTKAGLVEAVKQGQWRWYRRNEKALRRLMKNLRAQL